jgi:hypothetical protein
VLRFRDGVEQRATAVELFFDLVFVFAITQLSHALLTDLTVEGAARTLFLLLVVWWGWIYTTWMTNWFDPAHLSVRLVLIFSMLAAFLMAIAIPDAFGDRALLFAGGYVALQLVRNTFIVLATDDSEPLHASWVRMWIGSIWVGAIWLAGALVPDEHARVAIWLAALILDYGGPLAGFWAPGLGRTEATEWELEHGHSSSASRCSSSSSSASRSSSPVRPRRSSRSRRRGCSRSPSRSSARRSSGGCTSTRSPTVRRRSWRPRAGNGACSRATPSRTSTSRSSRACS